MTATVSYVTLLTAYLRRSPVQIDIVPVRDRRPPGWWHCTPTRTVTPMKITIGAVARLLAVTISAILLALATPLPASASDKVDRGSSSIPFCWRYPEGVPRSAYILEEYLRTHNLTPPRNWIGGRIYRNDDGMIPVEEGVNAINGPYREFDLAPKIRGQARGPERLVLGPGRTDSWYTPDHYRTFIWMYPISCFVLF